MVINKGLHTGMYKATLPVCTKQLFLKLFTCFAACIQYRSVVILRSQLLGLSF